MRIFILLLLVILSIIPVNAKEFDSKNIQEIDGLRAELSYYTDLEGAQYTKTKQKLEKLISKDKLDYTFENRFDDVQRLINIQNYSASIYELNDLIANGYQISKSNELLGDVYNITKKPLNKIANCYKEAIRTDADNISAQYKLAKLYLREKRNILGIENLKEVIQKTQDEESLNEIIQNKITPKDRFEANELYEALGLTFLKLNRNYEAYGALEKAIKLNPNDIYLKYYLADLYFINDQNPQAISLYSNILTINPHDFQIMLSKAKALEKNGNIQSAHKQYLEILSENPASNSAKYGIYRLYKAQNADVILKTVYGQKDFSKQDYIEFAQILKDKNDIQGANKFIEFSKTFDKKVIQEKPAPVLEKKEEKKEEIKKENKKPAQQTKVQPKKQPKTQSKPQKTVKKQEKIDEKAIREEITTPKTIDKTSKKYIQLKKTLDKYEAITPKDKYTYIAIANTYKLMGDLKSALENYKCALRLEPTDSDIQYNIGLTYMELNSFETAKLHLEKAYNLNPDNKKVINLLTFVNQKLITNIVNEAYTKFEAEQYVPAFTILENGIKKFPNSAQLYYYRALVFSKMNRNSAQIMDLQKAIELDPSYYMAYYQLGYAYEKIKDERNALVAWERFLSIEPEEKDLIKEIEQKVLLLEKKYY